MDVREEIQPRLESAIGERYEVIGPIGRGGMASVYLARHRVHGGFCAVKVLSQQLASQPQLVKSFLQEARASASLDEHPNIVNIVDIDEHAGLYYMIMKYVEGEDLSAYLKRKQLLTWKQAAYIAAEAAEALAWSHARGVIHRDMKPSNIRLNRRGGITVMDFGIAKVGQTPTSFTEMGACVGTPHYMAPEQIRGELVDHRTDLYSLGVILYEMATGAMPFRGANRSVVWNAHLHQEPVPPQTLEASIPAPLNHIIVTLLAKNPDNRYDSASRLVRHLRSLGLEGVGTTLDPVDELDLDHLRTQELHERKLENRSGPTPVITETGQTGGHAALDATEVTPVREATLPLPAFRKAPPAPQTARFELTDSRGALKPWVVAAGLVLLLTVGLFFALRPGRSSAPPNPVAKAVEPAPPIETPPGDTEAEAADAPAAVPAPKAEAPAIAPTPKATPKAAAPKTGAIYFRTTPTGAAIEVDSREEWKCTSPCWIESLTPGQHTVTARLDGYRAGVQRFEASAGGREPLTIELEADLISAMIASTPPGADIYINGEKRQEKTNARIPLAPGTYTVRVVLPGVADGEQSLVVNESQMPFASFALQAK